VIGNSDKLRANQVIAMQLLPKGIHDSSVSYLEILNPSKSQVLHVPS
jgi:hypothetical protein